MLNYLHMKLYMYETRLYKLYYRHYLATAKVQRNNVDMSILRALRQTGAYKITYYRTKHTVQSDVTEIQNKVIFFHL